MNQPDEPDFCEKTKTGTESGRLHRKILVHPPGSSDLSPGGANYQQGNAPLPTVIHGKRSNDIRVGERNPENLLKGLSEIPNNLLQV